MMTASRTINLLPGALACALLAVASLGAAQGFPSRPIRFVVPFGTGGSPDVVARVIARKLGQNLGQQVVVDNRAGASGIIAAETVTRAPADGHTLFVSSIPHLAINPHLYPKLPYDPLKDFVPVTLAVKTPLFLALSASLPVHSVKGLIAHAKSHPGLLFGSSGNGSQHHLGMELFKLLTGVDITHVPYKGVAQSVPALLSGDIALMLVALPSVLPHVKSGKVRLLAVADAKRSPLMPDLPTIAESGVPAFEISPEIGFVARTGTPKDVIGKLNMEIVKVLRTPEVVQQLVPLGIDPVGSTPEEYAESTRANLEKYGRLVKISGAKVD